MAECPGFVEMSNDPRILHRIGCPDCVSVGAQVLVGECRAYYPDAVNGAQRRLAQTMQPGKLYRCSACQLVFRHPVPSAEQLAEVYRELAAAQLDDPADGSPCWDVAQRVVFDKLGAASHARVLDVGAYSGAFLRRLPTAWDRLAIEPSENAHSRLFADGVRLVARFLEPALPEYRNSCDAVCLFDVFEHLIHPAKALGDAMSFLKPGGLLLVGTGNSDHWSWQLLRGAHWYLDPVTHICFAGRSYFQHLSKSTGWPLRSLIAVSHQHGGWGQRANEAMVVAYFGMRPRGMAGRLLARALGMFPRMRGFRHKEFPPYTPTIADHVLAVFEKPTDWLRKV